MRVAVISTKYYRVNIDWYIPAGTSVIVTNGSNIIEYQAEKWADENGIPKLVLHSGYKRYKPIEMFRQQKLIIKTADMLLVFWDGRSIRENCVIRYAQCIEKPVHVVRLDARWYR